MNKKFSKIKKIILYISLFFFLFSSFSFAESAVTGNFSYFMKSLFDTIASIWYIFPVIAGKLISNDFLYGNSFGLDVLLWQIWNFIRTLANFLIGFLFIYYIFKYLISLGNQDVSIIKNVLPKVAISSILVNMSWFIIAILIDISTILIAVFGALPQHFYSTLDDSVKKISIPTEFVIQKENCSGSDKACFPNSLKIIPKNGADIELEKLKNYEIMISGPLMFLGHSILGITNSQNYIKNNLFNVDSKKFQGDGQYVRALIQLFIFIMFIIPIFILIIVSIVRIFWIWIYIAFSPILFLNWVFGWNKLEQANKAFKFSNVIGLIFQPAFVVLAFSLSFVFVLSIAGALKSDSKYTEDVKKVFMMEKSDKGIVSISVGQIESMDDFSSWIGGFFGYLIVSFLTIFLIWSMIKISFKSTEVTSSIADRAFKFTEESLKSVPLPTPIGGVSIGALEKLGQDISTIPSKIEEKQVNRLSEIFGTKSDISQYKYKELDRRLKSDMEFESGLEDAFKLLSEYKGQNITSMHKNVKTLIDTIEEKMKSRGREFDFILEKFKESKNDYDEKLSILLSNQDTILDKFKR